MKGYQLREWQTFYNNNGHLSMGYGISGNQLLIINYSGSESKISWRDDSCNLSYRVSDIPANEFLKNYPEDRIKGDFMREKVLRLIREKFHRHSIKHTPIQHIEKDINKKLLLLL